MNLPAIRATVVFLCSIGTAYDTAYAQTDIDSITQRGQAALQARDYGDAEKSFAELAKLQPNVAEFHVTLGLVLFQENKLSEAEAEFRRAQKLKPTLPQIDALLAMTLSEQGKYEQALPGLEKGYHKSANADLKRMCGLRLQRTYTALHNDRKALEITSELGRLYPDDPEVLYYSSKVFGNQAFISAQKLFATAPKSIWGLLAAGEAHESQGQFVDAIADYREALKLDPNHPNLHFRIGRALLARSESRGDDNADAESAKEEFAQELRSNPTNGNAAYELGESYRKLGQEDEARRYFELAINSYPSFEEAHVGLAATLMQSDPALARTHLQKAIALNPEDAVAWYRLAQAERNLGHSEEQKLALAKFTALRNSKTAAFDTSGREVTPQQINPGEQLPERP
jgi:tetratricopeptide (TPR) repeat protein